MNISAYMDSHSLGLFAAFFVAGVLLWLLFNVVYMWLTPHDDISQLSVGNVSVALSLVGAEIGFMLPLFAACYVGGGLLGFVLWGMVGGAIQLAVAKALYWHSPTAIVSDNRAKAICFAGASLCAGIINAGSMIP